MTTENVLRLYNHYSFLASGKFNERDFDSKVEAKRKGEEAGRMAVGEMSQQRIDLIISDAKTHKEELEEKFPELKQLEQKEQKTEEPKEETKPKQKPKDKK